MRKSTGRSNTVLLLVVVIALVSVGLNYFYRQQLRQQDSRELSGGPASEEMIGRQRPSFQLPDRLGLSHQVGEWDGRVVMLNFWASWCKPCRREIPVFTELQDAYQDRGLQIVGLAIDDLPDVNTFIGELGVDINYPMLIAGEDRGIEIARDYGNRFGVLPYTVVIDRAGRIAFVQYGELTRAHAEQLLLRLL